MAAKGQPKTGGRTKGVPNKRSAALVAKAEASGMLPHEFLCAVSQGQTIDDHTPSFEERLDAAKAAAPYYAPKLASVDNKVSGDLSINNLPDDALDRRIAELVGKAGIGAAVGGEGKAH